MSADLGESAVFVNGLFSRDAPSCVVCDTDSPLVCPTCGPSQVCQMIAPTDCTQCARTACVDSPSAASSSTSSGGPSTNVGAIVGGVIGGIAIIAAVTYLVWRYCIKTRRQPISQVSWEDEQAQAKPAEMTFAEQRDHRASTHTAHSIASTVLTRASNIIQIAYIPGVTNRATPTSPTVLVPPVPPIPISISQATSPNATEDQHFFVPGNLRDSTYSGISGYTDRTSYAQTSYAPRSSVASTIYGKNAVIVAPAQTGMRAKPAMVSVKSANSSGSGGTATPPVPVVDYEKYNGRPLSQGSTFSVGSTFLNNASAHTATPARAIVVRMGNGGPKQVPINKPKSTEGLSPLSAASPSASRTSAAVTLIDDSSPVAAQDQGPFSDPPGTPAAASTKSLSVVIEEATRRASQRDASESTKISEKGPFGDEHATQD